MSERTALRIQAHQLLTDAYRGGRSNIDRTDSRYPTEWNINVRRIRSGRLPSSEVSLRFNPEKVLAPDPISDAFGRMTAFTLDGFTDGHGNHIVDTKGRFLDLGGGSGIFGVSVADTVRGGHTIHLDVVDIDQNALQTAELNITEATNRSTATINTQFINSDWLTNIPIPVSDKKYNIIYFNPPYLEAEHNITHSIAAKAPHAALYAETAWDEYAKVLSKLPDYLAEEGIAMVRLPVAPSEDMYRNLGDFCKSLEWPFEWKFINITAGEQDRKGLGLLIEHIYKPRALRMYSSENIYLPNGEAKNFEDALPLFHDRFCRIESIDDKIIAPKLGITR